ncbi:hypothetical protein [Burkholderia gladioli]|uniref:hypothetical protein n=1 Tax=Burkholderia gladioli TaxID=28095 RepID=UPI0034DB4FB9
MSKVTDWYPASVKPVREGEYDTRTAGSWPITTRKFMDEAWFFFDPVEQKWRPSIFGASDSSQWRGLAEKPE